MPRFNPYRWPFKYQSRFVYDKKPELAYKPLLIKEEKFFLNILRYIRNSEFITYLTTTRTAKFIEKQWFKRDPDKIWRQYELFVWSYKLQWILFWIVFFWYLIPLLKTFWYTLYLCNYIWVTMFEPSLVIPMMEYLVSVEWGVNLLCLICCVIFCFNVYLLYKKATGIGPWWPWYIFYHGITLYYIFYIFSYL